MHGSSGGTPVVTSDWGGLVTLASPDSLPAGASPRCHDNDYLVGSTGTRPGLTGVYSFAGSFVGPAAGSFAVNTNIGNPDWTNPTNILLDDGSFTTTSPSVAGSINTVTSAGSSAGAACRGLIPPISAARHPSHRSS